MLGRKFPGKGVSQEGKHPQSHGTKIRPNYKNI